MAIKFVKERERQKYLIGGFIVVLIITASVLWFGYFEKEETVALSPIAAAPIREIKINFEILENPLLIEFQPIERILYPFPGARDVSLTPTLSWESVSVAEVYFWEIIGVDSGQTEETSVTISKPLQPATTYVWRVKSCKKGGTECSAWSNNCQVEEGLRCWRFTTGERSFLILASPFPGARDVSLTPTLSWESVSVAEVYFWEIIGVDSGQTEETSVTISKPLQPATTYVWRVKSCKKGGTECSAWSSRIFTTSIILSPPGLILPPIEEISAGRENPFKPLSL